MADKHEFHFVVTGVDLSPEQFDRIGSAVAQAGALALAEVTPADALTVRIAKNRWWRGIPPFDIAEKLQEFGQVQSGELNVSEGPIV
jgi:hypothetical protein